MMQVDKIGIEKTYSYPYKRVFYACEDAIPRMNWQITESDAEKGYIFAIPNGEYDTRSAGIRIQKINEKKTLVKILEFHSIVKNAYKIFFYHADSLLKRTQ